MWLLLACFLGSSQVVLVNEAAVPLQAKVVVQSGQKEQLLWEGQVQPGASHEIAFSPSADGLVQLVLPGQAPSPGGYTTHGDDSVHQFVVDEAGAVSYTLKP